MRATTPEAKVGRLLLVILAISGSIVGFSLVGDPAGTLKYLGFSPRVTGTVSAWILATVITVAYVWSPAAVSTVRQYMFSGGTLKMLAVVTAVFAGILEEVVFRKWIMDHLNSIGYGPTTQVLASGIAFGLAHLAWGAKRLAAGINAFASTAILGCGLGIVYLLADRSLAPCVASHVIISALIEPGLLLAAVTDKLGYWNERA